MFDSVRNLPTCEESPLPVLSEAKLKAEHRRQQLEKWKAEKEEKRKQQLSLKKKPFIAGVVRAPLKFEPPPPHKTSTSGRVTRSQTRANNPKHGRAQSFAPKNATFRAPQIKTLEKLPILSAPTRNKNNNRPTFTFEPVAPNAMVKQTRSKTETKQTKTDIKNTNKSLIETQSTRGKTHIITKNASKSSRFTKNQQSSSESDIETSKMIKRVKTPGRNVINPKPLYNRPKPLVFESTTDGTSSDSSIVGNVKLKSKYSIISVNSSPDEKLSSETDLSPVRNSTVIRRSTGKSYFGSGHTSSDVEFVSEVILPAKKKNTKKSLPSTPMRTVPKSESNSEEKLRPSKSPIHLVLTPEQIKTAMVSPCVTLARGKDNARRETKWKMEEGNF